MRTTQEAYDWLAAQAAALGESHGAVVSAVLESMARSGAVLERPAITLAVSEGRGPAMGTPAGGEDAGVSAVPTPAPRKRKPAAKVTTAAELAKPPEERQEAEVPFVAPIPPQPKRCPHPGTRSVGGWCNECDHLIGNGGYWK